MRALLVAAASAAALLVLAGCGDTLSAGRVTGKRHEPARSFVAVVPITTGCGKYGCTFIYVPFTYYDDDWIFDLEKCDDHGKCKHGHSYVVPTVWNEKKIGDY